MPYHSTLKNSTSCQPLIILVTKKPQIFKRSSKLIKPQSRSKSRWIYQKKQKIWLQNLRKNIAPTDSVHTNEEEPIQCKNSEKNNHFGISDHRWTIPLSVVIILGLTAFSSLRLEPTVNSNPYPKEVHGDKQLTSSQILILPTKI